MEIDHKFILFILIRSFSSGMYSPI